MKKLISIFTALIVTLSMFAVSASAASPKLNKSSVKLPESYQVTLKVSGASGKVEWSVKDSSVASVKSAGDNSAKVTGKKTGSTYVYAKTDGKTLKCKVTVKQSFISASADSLDMKKGKSKTVTIAVKGSKAILAKPDDPDVCSVTWGKNWDGDKIELKVSAKNNGSTKIKLYNKNSPDSVGKIVYVTVGKQGSDKKASDPETAMLEQIAELVNKERKAAGKSELELDDTLNEIAKMRANELPVSFSHTRPDGSEWDTAFSEQGLVNCYCAENIAAGQKTAEEVMQSWMNSTGHKANILGDNYTKIGVGYCVSGGKYYWTQEFFG